MRKNTVENKPVLSAALVFFLTFMLIMFASCKKKEQSQEAQSAAEKQKAEASEKIGLRILYAGLLDTDRAKDFVDFLGMHFEKVKTTEYITFTAEKSSGFDVTILDYDGVNFKPPYPKISQEYSHAVITMGVPGGSLSGQLGLKTAYL
jgi:hypothetical protein